MNKSKLIERIAELVNEKIVDDISDVRDESDRDGMRIVIELKRGAQPEIVLNQLYKHTQMQESFSMIFLAVLNGQPRELGLDQAIRAFIDHRIDVVQRRTVFLLRKAREREHILEGYKIALDNLDTVIKIIRGIRLARRGPRESLRLGQGQRDRHHPRPRAPAARGERASRSARSTPSSSCNSIASRNSPSTSCSTSSKQVRETHRRVRVHPGQRNQAARGHRQGA